jgi:hypothetical protein
MRNLHNIKSVFLLYFIIFLAGCSGELSSQSPSESRNIIDQIQCLDDDCATVDTSSITSCFLQDQIISDGDSVVAYRDRFNCEIKETRACQDGKLSGDYEFAKCEQETNSCTYKGSKALEGASVTKFLNSVPNEEGSCLSAEDQCIDGSFSSGYSYDNCKAGQKSCIWNGAEIPHKGYVPAYSKNELGACRSEIRVCIDGSLTGSFEKTKCTQETMCSFNGKTVLNGESVRAYQNQNGNCVSELRVCEAGVLTGSFLSSNCQPVSTGCTFNGKSLVSGERVSAFESSSVPFSNSCNKEERVCVDGELSGSFEYSSCVKDSLKSCVYNNTTIPSGGVLNSFDQSTAASLAACQGLLIQNKCQDGEFNTPVGFEMCSVVEPSQDDPCDFNGNSVVHTGTIDGYKKTSVPFGQSCASERRTLTCNNGSFGADGQTYQHASCTVADAVSCSFHDLTIAHSDRVYGYKKTSVPFGQLCASERGWLTCTNGALSNVATYPHKTCTVESASGCSFNGTPVAHNGTIDGYKKTSVPFGQSCTSERKTLTCNNGSFGSDGQTYTHASCTVGAASSCTFNGTTVAHNGTINGYKKTLVPFGQSCTPERRILTCNNGSFGSDGQTYTHASCTVGAASSCTFNGTTVAHNGTINGYKKTSVPFGQSCTSERRTLTCNNGSFGADGQTYRHASCTVESASGCSFNGTPVAHNGTINGYKKTSVPFGQSCSAERKTLTCNNGSFGADAVTYSHASCSVAPASGCNFNGAPVAHNGTISGYKKTSVPFGQSCSAERKTLTCNNGSLGADATTYSHASCSVAPASGCSFNGIPVAHTGTIDGYKKTLVPYGQSCTSERRTLTCNNGSFGADAQTYQHSSCSVSNVRSCPIANGTGEQTYANGSWSSCTLLSCNPNTTQIGNSCYMVPQNSKGVLIGKPIDMELNEARTKAYITDAGLNSVVEVDLSNGNRRIISGYYPAKNASVNNVGPAIKGSGTEFAGNLNRFIMNEAGNSLLVYDALKTSAFRVNLTTGDRVELNKPIDVGQNKFSNHPYASRPGSQFAYVYDKEALALKKINLVTGAVVTRSGNGEGTGPAFTTSIYSQAVTLNASSTKAYVHFRDGVYVIDLNNGSRSYKSGSVGQWIGDSKADPRVINNKVHMIVQIGTTPNLHYITSDISTGAKAIKNVVPQPAKDLLKTSNKFMIEIDAANDRAIVMQNNGDLLSANLVNGAVSKVSANNIGSGDGFTTSLTARGVAQNNSGAFAFVGVDTSLVKVNQSNGSKVKLSSCGLFNINSSNPYSITQYQNSLALNGDDIYRTVYELEYSATQHWSDWRGGLIKISGTSGGCSVVSGRNATAAMKGSGPVMGRLESVALDDSGNFAYVLGKDITNGNSSLFKIDLSNGNRTALYRGGILSTFAINKSGTYAVIKGVGLGSSSKQLIKVKLSNGALEYFSSVVESQASSFANIQLRDDLSSLVGIQKGTNSIIELDLVSGVLSEISGANTGDGPLLKNPSEFDFSEDEGHALVFDLNYNALIKIDLTDGERSVISK